MSLVTRPPLTLGTQYANLTWSAMRSVVMVCHPTNTGGLSSRVEFALNLRTTGAVAQQRGGQHDPAQRDPGGAVIGRIPLLQCGRRVEAFGGGVGVACGLFGGGT